MNFEKIIQRFNDLAFLNNHRVAELQLLRKELYNLKIIREKIIFRFDPKKEYTFHYGGNKEFQFNFGVDYNFKEDKSPIFRYGIAFPIERNPHFFSPEVVFQPKVKIFNRFLSINKDYFKNYLMYIHRINIKEVVRFKIVQEIQNKDTFSNTFIFIGNYIQKPLNKITDSDIEIMLKSFDYLLEVYKYVESNKENETRIARICWNTNGWVKPSGKKGKTKSHSHEQIYGFGHEEWNFDTEKIINGYKYGFLEPIHKNRDKYINSKFDILLYTYNNDSKLRYWVGKLNNVEIINEEESLEVFNTYKKEKWLSRMGDDLLELNLQNDLLNEYIKEPEVFNIKFKIGSIQNSIYEKPVLAEPNDPRLIGNRYILLHVDKSQKTFIELDDKDGYEFLTGSSEAGDEIEKQIRKTYESKSFEYPDRHDKIQKAFMKYLQNEYGKENIRKECKAYGQNRIDIVRISPEGSIFYEVKSYDHLKTSLRVALGQLFEYSFYPDVQNASQLVLVSDLPALPEFEKYIHHLNTIISIPIHYIQFDANNKLIVKEI